MEILTYQFEKIRRKITNKIKSELRNISFFMKFVFSFYTYLIMKNSVENAFKPQVLSRFVLFFWDLTGLLQQLQILEEMQRVLQKKDDQPVEC